MNEKMDSFFHLSERKTDFKTELLAGLTIFITMTYVLVTQPGAFVGFGPASSVTDATGLIITKEAILLVTALISGIASIVMGLYANLPFVLSTGMGMNFVLGGMIQAGKMSFATAMTVYLIGGIIFVLLSIFGIRDIIVKSIPKNIKLGMCVIVGILLAWLGMKDAGIITGNPAGGFNFGNLSEKATLLGLFTFLLMAFLHARKIKGGVLISMIFATIIGIPLGVTTLPQHIVALPSFKTISSVSFKFDFSSALNISMFPLILISFSTDFFASLAAFLGLGSKAGMLDEEGNLPNIKRPFLVDSSFTVIGAMFGCSTITTFAESATGIEEGGRTGLTAIIFGICFILSMLFAPLFLMIPAAATGPALMFVGFGLIQQIRMLDFEDFSESFGAIVMILLQAFTQSMPVAISAGIITHIFAKLICGKHKDLNIGIYILGIILVFYFIFGV